MCLFYKYQKAVSCKLESTEISLHLSEVIEKRHSLSSYFISELTKKNLLGNTDILNLIKLRSSSKDEIVFFKKIIIEKKISKAYRSIIKHLRFIKEISEDTKLKSIISEWESLENEFSNLLRLGIRCSSAEEPFSTFSLR